MKKIFWVITFLILNPGQFVQAQSTAQKLGYSATDKVILVHADDIGMSHSV
ncbi:MAG: hypothetical protein JST84_23430, partial [Acidobacteria bacterium]|nr:hypothetical protein [Acidobacteriota bacterium]